MALAVRESNQTTSDGHILWYAAGDNTGMGQRYWNAA
jgi:hypothetical protein